MASSATLRFPAALRFVGAATRRVVAYALPPRCPGCGVIVDADHSFCLDCWNALDFLGGAACDLCAEPIETAFALESRCGACLADPPPFDWLRAGVAYDEIARSLALKLKHGQRPGIAHTMAGVMRRAGGDRLAGRLLVPVPLHRRRLWARGYNQSALIARALAKGGDAELALDMLRRTKATPLLRGLGRKARARAVAGAFALDPAWKDGVKGARVLLIDDVYTTSATVRGCAHVLRRAGAVEIGVLCWARVQVSATESVQRR